MKIKLLNIFLLASVAHTANPIVLADLEGFDCGTRKTTGILTSPLLKIERQYINFLIGDGGWKNETCMNLLLDDRGVGKPAGGDKPEQSFSSCAELQAFAK